MSKTRKNYPSSFKAKVALAALQEEETIVERDFLVDASNRLGLGGGKKW